MWITMLAMADKNGEVHGSIPGMARLAGMTIEEAEKSMQKLAAPDEYSRTPDFEGRRIAPIDGGWELLNHAKYRLMASKEDAKEANAARVKRHRSRNANVTPCNAYVMVDRDIAEAEAEAEEEEENIEEDKSSSPSLLEREKVSRIDLDDIASRISKLVPKWSHHLNGDERAALFENQAKWSDLSEDDWNLLSRWYADASPRSQYRTQRKAKLIAEVDQELGKAAMAFDLDGDSDPSPKPKRPLPPAWREIAQDIYGQPIEDEATLTDDQRAEIYRQSRA
jgi:hypothetical protein